MQTESKKVVYGILLANIPLQLKAYSLGMFDVTAGLFCFAVAITGVPYVSMYTYFGTVSKKLFDALNGGVKFGGVEIALTVVSVVFSVGAVVVLVHFSRKALLKVSSYQ